MPVYLFYLNLQMAVSGLEALSWLLGWIFLNHKRRRTTGLSIDFVYTNFYGMLCYSIYTASLRFSETVRAEYRLKHNGRDNLIAANDVVFAVHVTILSFVMFVQIVLYRERWQAPSNWGVFVASLVTVLIAIGSLMVILDEIETYSFVTILGYCKIALTIIKYAPQVWLNICRGSTVGWSIYNTLFDFSGGVMSVAQLFLDAYIAQDWSGIRGASAKLVLGLVSIAFDITFMIQHYVIYPSETDLVHSE